MRPAIDRVRVIAFAAGCGLLFWQHDAAAVDWLFGLGIVASAVLWAGGAAGFDLARPQPLLLLFLGVTAATTTLAGGVPHFFAITAYLVAVTLALSSTLRRDPRRARLVEAGIVVAACVTAAAVFAGAMAARLDVPALDVLAHDQLRGRGLFKDANVAGGFLACSYPIAVAYCARLGRWRGVFALLVTALFTIGVIYTYSRLALLLLVVAVVAVTVALAVSRERRLLAGVGASAVLTGAAAAVAAAAGIDAPLFRYQPVQSYDATGRVVAWLYGARMIRESPLGTGAGSFELRAEAYSEEELALQRMAPDGSSKSPNLLRNGALDGLKYWNVYLGKIDAVGDPTSVSGLAIQKRTTAIYQDVVQWVSVKPGRTYSFAAQIRTDGSEGLLIVHWRDERGVLIAQAGSDPVTSTSWTESRLLDETAPAGAAWVFVFLSNRQPGEQLFAAVRMVEGATVPAWAPSMQWGTASIAPPGKISAHNTYLRIGAESGLPGLAAFSAYVLMLAWASWRWGRGAWQWPISFSLILLAGLVIDTLHWRALWVYAAVVAALLSAPVTEHAMSREAPQEGSTVLARTSPAHE